MTQVRKTVLDRAIEWVSPIRGRERYRARMQLAMADTWSGASRTRRSLKNWNPFAGDANRDTALELPVLRARARDLARNSPLATGAINTAVTSVVGPGLRLKSNIDRDFLGMEDEAADAWEARAEREFHLWADSQNCDAARSGDFGDLQDLAFRATLESGDAFVLLPMIERVGTPYELAVQVLEADRIGNPNGTADAANLIGGVRLNPDGSPDAYHLYDHHPGSLRARGVGGRWVHAFGNSTGRRNMLHLYRKLRPGQVRGVPYLAPVIEALKQLDRYTEAELQAAVVSAMFTVFVKTENGDPAFGPESVEAGTVTTSAAGQTMNLGNGLVVGLSPGEDISTANPGRPNESFDPFVQAVLRQIGVALEIPFELLIKHYTASYSASRAALLEAWRFFRARRMWLSRAFCQPVYESFLTEAIALGRLNAPGFLNGDSAVRWAYSRANWIGTTAGHLNPLQEANAVTTRIGSGLTTLAHEAAEYNGGDWEANHSQSVKERRMRLADGLLEQTRRTDDQREALPDDDE